MNTSDLYDLLVDEGYFTEDELQLITNINGYNVDTLNDCIYARYGQHSYEQLKGESDDEV